MGSRDPEDRARGINRKVQRIAPRCGRFLAFWKRPAMRSGDPRVFGRNVRAFRALRGWGVRELSERAGVSTKTIVKIERGEGCTSRTEAKIALGFSVYLGRLWDDTLLSSEGERLIRKDHGRWFFSAIQDAELFHQRLSRSDLGLSDERFRSDPDEIQDESERLRLGHGGL